MRKKVSISMVVIILIQTILPLITGISLLPVSYGATELEAYKKSLENMGAAYYIDKDNKITNMFPYPEKGVEFFYEGIKYRIDQTVSSINAGYGENIKIAVVDIYDNLEDVTIYDFLDDVIVNNGVNKYDFEVIGINAESAKGNKNIKSLKIWTCKDRNRYIGKSAFEGCENLETVGIYAPEGEKASLWKIDDFAFKNCTNLEKVDFGTSFFYNPILSITDIGVAAFYGCSSLEEMIIPVQVKTIYDYTFYKCTNLENVYVPLEIERIGPYAFAGCANLSTIGLTSSHPDANYIAGGSDLWSTYCEKNTAIIRESLKELWYNAFEGCAFSKAVIYGNVKIIGQEAFLNCSNLETVLLPNTLEEIRASAFEGCSKLEYIAKDVADDGIDAEEREYAFNLPDNLTNIESKAFAGTNPEIVTVPLKITKLENSVFSECDNLEKVILPSKLQTIGHYTFENCSKLKTIKMYSKLEDLGKNNFDGKDGEIVLPRELETLGKGAFMGCGNIEKIVIPRKIEKIDVLTFDSCEKLERVVFTEDQEYKLQEINLKAFYNCKALSTIGIDTYGDGNPDNLEADIAKLPNNLIAINSSAFTNTALKKVILNNKLETIANNAFAHCSNLEKFIYSNPKLSSTYNFKIDDGILYNQDKTELMFFPAQAEIKKLELENETSKINEYAFYKPKNLEILKLNNSEMTLDESTFKNIINPLNVECTIDSTTEKSVKTAKGSNDNITINGASDAGEETTESSLTEAKLNAFVAWIEKNINKQIPNLKYTSDMKIKLSAEGWDTFYKPLLNNSSIEYKWLYHGNGDNTTVLQEWGDVKEAACVDSGWYELGVRHEGLEYEKTIRFEIKDEHLVVPEIPPIISDQEEVAEDSINPTIREIKVVDDEDVESSLDGEYVKGPAKIVVEAEDNIENNLGYSFDGGVSWNTENWKAYEETVENIQIIVKDEKGNRSDVREANIYVDSTRPTIQYQVIDKNNTILSINQDTGVVENSFEFPVKIKVTANDNESGLDKAKCQIRDFTSDTEVETTTMANSSNEIIVENINEVDHLIIATDNVGNVSSIYLAQLVSPKLEYTIKNANGEDITKKSGEWVKEEITIEIAAMDNATYCFDYDPVNKTGEFYTINKETINASAGSQITIAKQDTEGNVIYNTITIPAIDKVAPSFNLEAQLSEECGTDEENKKWYKQVRINIKNAEDTGSGLEDIYSVTLYYKDKTGTTTYYSYLIENTGCVNIKDASVSKVDVTLFDKAGNSKTLTIENELASLINQIDATRPIIEDVELELEGSVEDGWATKATLKIDAVDNETGMSGDYSIALYEDEDIDKLWNIFRNDEGSNTITIQIEGQAKYGLLKANNNADLLQEKLLNFSNSNEEDYLGKIKIDTMKPSAHIEIEGYRVTAKEGEEIKVIAEDKLSGLPEKAGAYCFDGENWVKENSYSYEEAGEKVIQVRDKAGNVETLSVTIEAVEETPGDDTGDGTGDNTGDNIGDVTEDKLEVSSTEYQISGSYIKGIQAKTTTSNLLKNITTNAAVKVVYKGEANTEYVGTGMKLVVTLNNETKEYTLVVKGDTTGDGIVDFDDISEINKHRRKGNLSELKQIAGDVDGDGDLDFDDISQINKYRRGKIQSL